MPEPKPNDPGVGGDLSADKGVGPGDGEKPAEKGVGPDPDKPFMSISKSFKTQEEYDDWLALQTQSDRKALERTEKELSDLKLANATDAEKAQMAKDDEHTKNLEDAKKTFRLSAALQTQFKLTETQAENMAKNAGLDWDSTKDAIEKLEEEFGLKRSEPPKGKLGPSEGGNSRGDAGEGWTTEKIDKALDGLSPTEQGVFWKEHGPAIRKHQAKEFPHTTYVPGQ